MDCNRRILSYRHGYKWDVFGYDDDICIILLIIVIKSENSIISFCF